MLQIDKNAWYVKKYQKVWSVTNFSIRDLKKELKKANPYIFECKEDRQFCWENINPHYHFFYDYSGIENDLTKWLLNSKIKEYPFLYVDLQSNCPVVKIPTEVYIENWEDFVNISFGLGCFAISEDFKLLLEFTPDWERHLYSNFPIKPDNQIADV